MTPINNIASTSNRSDTTLLRVSEIDLLRFIAAMLVVLFHYTFRGHAANNYSLTAYPEIAFITQYGYLGVELFFLVSGFVIMMTASSGSLRKFVASRIARLYPAFWVCCTITFVVILSFGGDRFSANPAQFFLNMTMLNEFFNVKSIDGVYWSLAVELKFYFLVSLVLLLRQIDRAQWFLGFWLMCSVVLVLLPVQRLHTALMVDYSPYFIGGAVCFLAHRNGWSLVRGGMVAIALMLALRATVESATGLEKAYNVPFDPVLMAMIISAFFVVMILIASKKTASIFRGNWALLGALTYPLYLLHQNIGYILLNAVYTRMNPYLALLLILVLALLASYAVHRLIEKPFGKRLGVLVERLLSKLNFRHQKPQGSVAIPKE